MSINNVLKQMENVERLKCPYCSVMALFNYVWTERRSSLEVRQAFCQGCGEGVVQVRNVTTVSGRSTQKKHKGCWVLVWPRNRVMCSDDKIPEEIRNDLNNAGTIVDITPDASAGLTRRALERILRKYLGLNGKDLYVLIEKAERILHPRIFSLLGAVRLTGVFGVHSKEDVQTQEIISVEKNEALIALDTTIKLAEDWFIQKPEAEAFVQNIKSKKQRTIKDPKKAN